MWLDGFQHCKFWYWWNRIDGISNDITLKIDAHNSNLLIFVIIVKSFNNFSIFSIQYTLLCKKKYVLLNDYCWSTVCNFLRFVCAKIQYVHSLLIKLINNLICFFAQFFSNFSFFCWALLYAISIKIAQYAALLLILMPDLVISSFVLGIDKLSSLWHLVIW